MKNYRLLTIIGAALASLCSSWLPAIAAPDLTYNGAQIYKDAKDNVYYVTTTLKSSITYDNVQAHIPHFSFHDKYLDLFVTCFKNRYADKRLN